MRILTIDPGLAGCGVAASNEKQIERALYVACEATAFEERLDEMPARLLEGFGGSFDLLLIEFPQTYGGRASRGDTNDLLRLCGMASVLFRHGAQFAAKRNFVAPSAWKSNVDSDICVQRAQMRLSPNETKRVALPSAKSLQHNVWDAVGINLWACRRWFR
jgi:hypothetical protein